MSEMSFKVENGVIDANADGGEYVPILPPPNYIVNVASLGILPTNTGTQNADAWDAAMAALDPVNKSIGARWIFGNGNYNFSRTLKITRQMTIEGVTGKDSGQGTRFLFPPSTTGLHVTGYDDPLGQGVLSIVRNIRVSGSYGETAAHGILIHATCRIEHLFVEAFSGDGIHIDASATAEARNANGWFLQDVTSALNWGNGLSVHGADANGGTAINCNLNSNSNWAVYDVSDLGNYYFGLVIEANGHYTETDPPVMVGGGIWASNPMACSVFVGCYLEGDSARANSFDRVHVDSPAMFLGGFHGSGTGGFTGSAVHLVEGVVLRKPLSFTYGGDVATGTVTVGGYPTGNEIMAFYPPNGLVEGGGNQKANWTGILNDGSAWVTKAFGFGSWGAPGNWSFFLPTPYSRLWPQNMDMSYVWDHPVVPRGIFLRSSRLDFADAEPDAINYLNQTWNQGDVAFNRVVSPGGKMGWVCVTNGTLGSYTEGRTLTANGTTSVTLDAPSEILRVGMELEIGGTGPRNRIREINGVDVTMTFAVPTGSGLSIAYVAPVFKAWGAIDP